MNQGFAGLEIGLGLAALVAWKAQQDREAQARVRASQFWAELAAWDVAAQYEGKALREDRGRNA